MIFTEFLNFLRFPTTCFARRKVRVISKLCKKCDHPVYLQNIFHCSSNHGAYFLIKQVFGQSAFFYFLPKILTQSS